MHRAPTAAGAVSTLLSRVDGELGGVRDAAVGGYNLAAFGIGRFTISKIVTAMISCLF
jgi:hypothetical protein